MTSPSTTVPARDGPHLRRLAGVGAAVAVVSAVVAGILGPDVVVLPAVLGYGVGLPTATLVDRRTGGAPTLRRYTGIGLGVGVVTGLVLGLPQLGDFTWLVPIVLGVTIAAGLVGGATVAFVARRLPAVAVLPVAVLGLAASLAAGAWAWWANQPPAPHDFLLVAATPEVEDHYGSAMGLSDAVIAGFRSARKAGADPVAHSTWVEVIEHVTLPDLGDSRLWAKAEQHPVTAPDGTPTRLVTVGVGDHRVCVVVRPDDEEQVTGTCDAAALRTRSGG